MERVAGSLAQRTLDDEALLQRPDEVVVFGAAVRTSESAAVLAEEVEDAARLEEAPPTALARETLDAARHRREDVVGVHGADDEAAAVPALVARRAAQATALEAAHADGVQVEHLVVKQHLQLRVIVLWREEEGAVDERVLVEDGHRAVTHHAAHHRHLVRAQVGEDEAADLVVAVRTLVLHLDVVRVLLAARQLVERRQVGAPPEYVAGGRLHRVGEELEVVLAAERSRRQRRRAGRAGRARAGAREATRAHAQLWPAADRQRTRLLLLAERQHRHLARLGALFTLFPVVAFRRGNVIEIFAQVALATATVARLVREIVALLRPQILQTLLLAPATCATARAQIGQHMLLPIAKTIAVHPPALIAVFVVTYHFDGIA